MGLFHRTKPPAAPLFSLEEYEPVIRSSICTGEQVACMRNRATGQLREVMLLRTESDLAEFCRLYGLRADEIKTVY